MSEPSPTEPAFSAVDLRKEVLKAEIETAEILGWYPFGYHDDMPGNLRFRGEDEDGLPKWEQPIQ